MDILWVGLGIRYAAATQPQSKTGHFNHHHHDDENCPPRLSLSFMFSCVRKSPLIKEIFSLSLQSETEMTERKVVVSEDVEK